MSNLSKTNFASTAAEYLKSRQELEEKNLEFSKQLKGNINAYNTVVRNLARKFNSDTLKYSTITARLAIHPDAVLKTITKDYYVFEYDGKTQSIHKNLLRNDPIAVSQYVRYHIRQLQTETRANEYKSAKAAKDKANRELKAVQRNFEQAEKTLALLDRQANKRATQIEERLRKKIAQREQASQSALASK